MTIAQVRLPSYTVMEEICNSVSHAAGTALGITALLLCLERTLYTGDPYRIATSIAYCISIIILYASSTVYHALKRNNGKRVMRVVDHCTIFLLIAGTYAPYSLIVLREYSSAWGWAIFSIVTAAGIVGIVLNACDIERFKVFSIICYLSMGWAIIVAIKPLTSVFNGTGLSLLVAGGVAYTLGAVLYGIGARVKYIHSVFHVFVVLGSVLHFISIYMYVL